MKSCSLLYVHHCHLSDDVASVWALPGIAHGDAADAPAPEEYGPAVLILDHVSNGVAMRAAERISRLLNDAGVESHLAVTADD